MRQRVNSNDYEKLEPNDIYQFFEMISVMARYAEPAGDDDSEKYVYTATSLLTTVLVSLTSMDKWNSKLKKGIIEGAPGEKYGIGKRAKYDINNGDLSDYYEIASELM